MSRASIVAMLVAVEIVIAGVALYIIGGTSHMGVGHFHGVVFAAPGLHHRNFVAAPIAAIPAGTSPHVTIDDAESRVVVTASNDGMVHVKDLTNADGAFFSDSGTIPQLTAVRTADGVAISRPSSNRWHAHFQIGSFEQRIEVEVPAGTKLDVAHCGGAEVSGLENGGVNVHSQDGRIVLTDLRGNVDARSDDGSVTVKNMRGDSLAVQSADGHLELRDIAVASLNATTSDGRIDASGLTIAGASPKATLHTDDGSVHVKGSFAPPGAYEISTHDGSMELGLGSDADLTVDASTADGRIVVDGNTVTNGDGDGTMQHSVKLGNGAARLRLTSGDGSIHIQTNGAV